MKELRNKLKNSLDVAKKFASQKHSGTKVQKARDTCGAKNELVHQKNDSTACEVKNRGGQWGSAGF
eukprot:1151808-Pelagomonas_calceolata.AAC.4